jgi:hypothetical protein
MFARISITEEAVLTIIETSQRHTKLITKLRIIGELNIAIET